jgi:hypothetical protein
MTRLSLVFAWAVVLAAPVPAARAQTPTPAPGTPPLQTFAAAPDAMETREQLQNLLRQYPPAVGEVLQRDPSLLSRPDYLAPYPALTAFLAQHPDVVRNPSFYFGSFTYYRGDPKDRAYEMFGILLGGIAGLAAAVTFVSILVWLVRSVIDHRRWVRLSRVQTDVHTKLMDRLTSNDDLLAYIQSPVGRRFLESAPIPLEGEPKPTSAPVGRILWSLQAGIVLVALGIGFWFAQKNVLPEVSEGFFVVGVIAISLGIGFALSAIAAYVLSIRLGLMAGERSERAA